MSPDPLRTWREANASIFQPTVARAAQNLGIPALAVEKDYWVCQALRAMEAAHPGVTVFKGGTSLEKMGIVARFSEDLDLIVTGSIGGGIAGPKFLKTLCEAAQTATGGTLTDGRHSGKPGSLGRPASARRPAVEPREVTSLLARQLSATVNVSDFPDLAAFSVRSDVIPRLRVEHANAMRDWHYGPGAGPSFDSVLHRVSEYGILLDVC